MELDDASLNRLWQDLKDTDEDAAHDLAVLVECRRIMERDNEHGESYGWFFVEPIERLRQRVAATVRLS